MADKQQPQEPAENRDDQQRNQQPQEPAEAQQPQQEPQAQEAQEITIDTSGYNPAADPGNPAFDMATWQAAVDKAGGSRDRPYIRDVIIIVFLTADFHICVIEHSVGRCVGSFYCDFFHVFSYCSVRSYTDCEQVLALSC